METNSIGHENKYHLQVTFEDKTDPKTQRKCNAIRPKSLIASAFLSCNDLTFATTKHCEKVAP